MAIEKLEDDLNIISALDDKPSMDATELKKKFDEAGNIIKDYINEKLIKQIEEKEIDVVNDLTTGGTKRAGSAEMLKKLNQEKQSNILYGKTVPTLAEGQVYIQIFD